MQPEFTAVQRLLPAFRASRPTIQFLIQQFQRVLQKALMDAGVTRIDHGSDVYVVRSCYHEDGQDLLAFGGEHSVEVYQISTTSAKRLASFHIGTRVTALAWSPRTLSPSRGDGWLIEIAAAGIDFGLHLLTKSASSSEYIFPFGGGLSGHHGKVNDMCFCGGHDQENKRYVASVSDDRMLMVWDLQPTLNISSGVPSPESSGRNASFPPNPRPQPTAYVIAFPHPLITVNSHPGSSKEFLISDCCGSIFLTDWRTDPVLTEQGTWRHSTLVELVEPHALKDSLLGKASQNTGFAAWRRDNADMYVLGLRRTRPVTERYAYSVGANYGSRFAIWDMSKLRGGKPVHTGISFQDGGHIFRWCPTNSDYFAIAAYSLKRGAVLHVHNIGYVNAQPSIINVAPRPHRIRDFDFMALRGQPLLAIAFGRHVVVFSIGDE